MEQPEVTFHLVGQFANEKGKVLTVDIVTGDPDFKPYVSVQVWARGNNGFAVESQLDLSFASISRVITYLQQAHQILSGTASKTQ